MNAERLTTITPKFMTFMPRVKDMEDGIIYVSLKWGTAIHKCACGCQHEVVTPIGGNGWAISFDIEKRIVSLTPSIGNWQFECQSHYFIRNNQVDWA